MAADLRLLLDQGLPRETADELRNEGTECFHIGELGMFAASDTEILLLAREQGFIVVTLDADFHAILAVSGAVDPSVVRIRLQGLKGAAVAHVIRDVIRRYAVQLAQGCMITVKQRKTTCHLLSRST